MRYLTITTICFFIISMTGEVFGQNGNLILNYKDLLSLKNSFDLDGDGVVDVQLKKVQGRGPLSTYYTLYELHALNGAEFMAGGIPLKKGRKIVLADILTMKTKKTVLCSVGGSLRFPNESYEKFSSGTWWNKKGKLGIVWIKDKMKVGLVDMQVTKKGDVTFGKATVKKIEIPTIEVQ